MKTAKGMWRTGAVIACLVMAFCCAPAAGEGTVPGKDGPIPIYPAPVEVKATGEVLAVGAGMRIVLPEGDARLEWTAEMLSEELGKALGAPEGKLAIVGEKDVAGLPGATDIVLGCVGKGRFAPLKVGALVGRVSPKSGAYVLRVAPTGIGIYGRDANGVFYGGMTLLQLFTQTGPGKGEIVRAEVVDYPYQSYRGIRSALPRGIPRQGEITHEYYRDLLRLWGFCRLNHVWVQGCGFNTPLRRHPETAWADVLTIEQAKGIVGFAERQFLNMDGTLDFPWLNFKYKNLAEVPEGETYETHAKKVRKMSRVNPCPSNPAAMKLMLEQMEDTMDVLTGDHFAVPMDEMYQEINGGCWGVCALCKGKDPVKLWADMANTLIAKVLERGKTPILGGGMLMYEHQGWYKDIYTAIDMVKHRDKILIYNWSEGHIRRGAMRVKGKRLRNENFSATPYFKKHGYKNVIHMFAGAKWRGRPEMREVNGKLDCGGGFVSYYHAMNYEVMKQRGTITRTVFSAQHLWSPDVPKMDSEEDDRACRYAEAIADVVLAGKTYVEAIAAARKAYAAPPGTLVLKGGALGRSFASASEPVVLLGAKRGDRTEGTMELILPVEEGNPAAAYLVLTINDWDQTGEGEIYLNGHKIKLARSRLSNNRDYRFPPILVPNEWLKFGPEPNVVRFVYKSTAGFTAKKMEVIISDTPAGR